MLCPVLIFIHDINEYIYLVRVRDNAYKGRNEYQLNKLKLKYRLFCKVIDKLASGTDKHHNKFTKTLKYINLKDELAKYANQFYLIVQDDLTFGANHSSSLIKPSRKSQTHQNHKGRKRTTIHKPFLDSDKQKVPRRKRITPVDSFDSKTSQPNVSFGDEKNSNKSSLLSLVLSPYGMFDDDIELLNKLGYT